MKRKILFCLRKPSSSKKHHKMFIKDINALTKCMGGRNKYLSDRL